MENVLTVAGFHRACRQGNIAEAEMFLCDDRSFLYGLSGSSEDTVGSKASCVHFAVLGNQPDILRFLASNGADVSCQTDRGVSPLQVACSRGYVDCAIILVECGANVTCKNNYGQTPSSILRAPCGDVFLKKNRDIILKQIQKASANQNSSSSRLLKLTDKLLYNK
jgi:hypothetical protein